MSSVTESEGKVIKDYGAIYKPNKKVQVIKKDGTKEAFNVQKVIVAIDKSAYRALTKFTDEEKDHMCQTVIDRVNSMGTQIPIQIMHNIVESALEDVKPIVAKSYRDYRNYKQDFVRMMDDVYKKSQSIMYIGDKENANTDSALVATKRSLTLNQLNKELYQKFFMTTEEIQACREGYIYVHDMSARRDTMNCCLADIGSILKGGFEMGNIWYNEPKSLDTVFDVIGDIVLSMASQQYGGYTVPEVDTILEPYAEKSYNSYLEEYLELGVDREKAEAKAYEKVAKDMRQGFQGWEYKFNTVGSSRGDYPFITISAGIGTGRFAKLAAITMLNVRRGGQGKKGRKKPVLFPKIVFLYDENLHGPGKELEDVFEAGVACSAKTMYPDWLSLTGRSYVPSIYKKYGKVVSPMGCVDGQEVITYRYKGKLYVEAFVRMWNRLAKDFKVKEQPAGPEHLYIDLKDVEIYDKEKKGFVKTEKIIRNTSTCWVDLHLSNGRRLLCTADHPITTAAGITKHACELTKEDQVIINSEQYAEDIIPMDVNKAWLLGFMLCDGCYSNYSVFASIALDSEDDIEKKFHDIFPKIFGMGTRTVVQMRGIKGSYKDLRAYSDGKGAAKKVCDYFTEQFGGVGKKERQIPNEIFEWTRNAKLAFMAGMIDADGYLNPTSHGGTVVQIGSTNKELALQQMALAQALGMPAKIYYNKYNKKKPDAIRYRVEFFATKELVEYLASQKKKDCFKERTAYQANIESGDKNEIADVMSVETIAKKDFSYDVTTESAHFDVSGIWSHNCRAFLSPWYERGGMKPADENDTPVFIGRFNIGAVSLHLPMILAKARQEGRDFYEVLDYYLNLIRQLHIRTYAYLGEMRASTNPLGYCEGGFYGGHLGLHDKIKPLLKPMTASFGITALNELQMLYNGKSLVEDGAFALEVMEYINKEVNRFKEEDGNLYAIYGTPAENLCGLQVKQFRAKYGIIEGVSDREYVSNSFHCHVTEDITPIQKQDLEYRFWDLFNGGKIQYVKYPIDYNLEAIRTLIRRAMDMGYYEGVNMSLAYCDDCGHQELEMDVCPKCGSRNLTKIDRMNGYLAYSRVHGDTRLSEPKMAEIAERKSM